LSGRSFSQAKLAEKSINGEQASMRSPFDGDFDECAAGLIDVR
jgi:hypothetical protein